MLTQEAALLLVYFPAPPSSAPPWHFLQCPCTSDSLACLDQLEKATKFLAAIFQRSMQTPFENKGVVYHISKGTGKEMTERSF